VKRFGLGLVIGKLWPFHRGHGLVIERAARESERVTVLVCGTHEQDPPVDVRAGWVAASFPLADVRAVDQDACGLADDDTVGWAGATLGLLGEAPDAVFTSEEYGDAFAAALGCAHRLVDRERRAVPISARAIRADPLAHLDFLEPHVRAHYVKRVCILGAESTGKTTLTRALADRFRTPWVPEYGAVYEAVGRTRGTAWRTEEFLHVARIRDWLEELLAGSANRVLVCDTDTFTTACWHERYLGFRDPELERLAAARRYDLYLLCDAATPFVQDAGGFRVDGPHRRTMDTAYREHLRALGAEPVELRGTPGQRLEAASTAVETLLGG
jgi:HTH-type transcriptional regulator, transcriptional repressor of NAD biosynthesis genes